MPFMFQLLCRMPRVEKKASPLRYFTALGRRGEKLVVTGETFEENNNLTGILQKSCGGLEEK